MAPVGEGGGHGLRVPEFQIDAERRQRMNGRRQALCHLCFCARNRAGSEEDAAETLLVALLHKVALVNCGAGEPRYSWLEPAAAQ